MTWMTRRRFEWLIQARGTELSAWPEAERRGAVALLRRSGPARQAMADLLAAEEAPAADPASAGRMALVLRRSLAPLPVMVRGIGWSALAACIGAGLYLGVGVTEGEQPDLLAPAQTVSFAALDQ